MSLRARLSAVILVVVAVALTLGNLAVYRFAGDFLEERLDDQLRSLQGPALGILRTGEPPPDFVGATPRALVAFSGGYVELRDERGNQVGSSFLLTNADQRTAPKVPNKIPAEGQEVFVNATAHDGTKTIPYRARLLRLPGRGILVTAIPSTELRDTKHELVVIALIVTAAVLVIVVGLTWWIVGVALRPLRRIEEKAGQIAGGDLSQRVEPSGTRTELERLGASLNGMLTEIETAFAAKEVSEKRLRRFVGDASHELRTPLTSIRGYAELLRRGAEDDPEQRVNATRRIEEETRRLGSLVEQLLLLARLDEGEDMQLAPLDLVTLVRNAVADARVAGPDCMIDLDAPDSVTLEGDQDRLTQVVTNLLGNARVHTPAGTPLEVRVQTIDGDAMLEVIDHGPGIDAAHADQLFDRFWRADTARTRARGGTGLGLSIVAAIVHAHRGTVEVVETPGGGATFRVRLPLTRDPERATAGEHVAGR